MNTTTTPRLRRNLFLLLMLCFAAAMVGDSTAEALVLAHFGPGFIPRMFLVNAVALFFLSAGLLSLIDRIDRGKFFCRALLVHGSMLLLLRCAAGAKWNFLYLPLFSYAYSSKILFFLLFWTIANDLIDSRSAGKVFPSIAAGGTIGAIGISFCIPGLMKFLAVENLLLIWALVVVAAALTLYPLRHQYQQLVAVQQNRRVDAETSAKNISLPQLFRDEPLLRNMSALYFLIFFLLLNQHMLFYREIKNVFSSANEIVAFLGGFNGVSMLSTCLLQVGIAGILMRRLGSTRSMLLMPIALLVIFAGLAMLDRLSGVPSPALFWMIVVGMGVRMAFFDAFFSPNFQLFFSSLPREIRGRGKLLIEGVVKPAAMVCAGSWLLWCVPRISTDWYRGILVVLAGVALVFSIRLKNAYATTLQRYLTGNAKNGNSALLERLDFSGDEDVLTFLAKKMEYEDFEVRKFLIEIIASAKTDEAAMLLLDYVDKKDATLRATVVAALGNFPADLVAQQLTESLGDSDPRVVANAVESLAKCRAPALDRLLEPMIDHPNRRVRSNVILALWAIADRALQDRFFVRLKGMIDGNSPDDQASALYVIGELDDDRAVGLLFDFCTAHLSKGFQSERVERQAVGALGTKPMAISLELLLQISRSTIPRRRGAIVAKAALILPFVDESTWRGNMSRANAVYRNCLVKALRKANMRISAESTTEFTLMATREIDAIEWEKGSLAILSSSGAGRMALLSCAIREELIAIRLDTLLNLVALLDRSGAVGAMIPRIRHSDAHVRARALEALENTGDAKINRAIIATIEWLDTIPPPLTHDSAPVRKKELMAAATYSSSHNEWVATCAEYACASPVDCV